MQRYKSEYFKDDSLPYLEVWRVTHEKKQYKPHFHYMLSIGVVEKEEVEFIYNGEILHLNAGELIAFNPETVHVCNLAKKDRLAFHMICLDITWCKAFQEAMWDTKLDAFVKINTQIIENEKIYKSFLELSTLLRNQSIFHLEKEVVLHEFMENFFNRFTTYGIQGHVHNISVSYRIELALKYLKQNIRKNITVAQLASKASLSEYHFMRMFKQYTGMSAYAYLINQKINLAQQLLLKGIPIAEVALEVGFVDQSHLSRHFHSIVAMSPGEFVRASGANAD
jgi:AraC-like DNA-binding protein